MFQEPLAGPWPEWADAPVRNLRETYEERLQSDELNHEFPTGLPCTLEHISFNSTFDQTFPEPLKHQRQSPQSLPEPVKHLNFSGISTQALVHLIRF